MLRSKIGDRAKGGEAFGKRRVGMLKGHLVLFVPFSNQKVSELFDQPVKTKEKRNDNQPFIDSCIFFSFWISALVDL